jgi:N5-(cytidine 5'-diphosphoramidyl)-L-glutamine hydrolase
MKNKKRRIGITLRVENILKYNEKRDAISHEWVKLIEKLDMIPIFIPNTLNDVKLFVEELELDGLILSGGDNKGDEELRDQTENILIKFGMQNKIPILGICRGMQVINDYFGGNIIITKNNEHVNKDHEIIITDKKIREILEFKEKKVNSYHHNIILEKNLGKGLKSFAKTNDNTIEGFLHNEFPIIGIMWHPERNKNLETEIKFMKMFSELKNN